MYVAILFDYLPVSDLYHWYIHMASACTTHGFPLITVEYYLKQEFNNRFNLAFHKEMPDVEHFSADSLGSLEQYAVPDDLFHGIEKKSGSYTAMQVKLLSERVTDLEDYIEKFLGQALSKRPDETLEGIFSFGDTFESLRFIAKKHSCPIVAVELSAIRAMTGQYTMSLYYANIDGRLHSTRECQIRYENFLEEKKEVPLLSRRELIALFCKEESLMLIPLLDSSPKFEIAGFGSSIIRAAAPLLLGDPVTDDDLQRLFRECFSSDTVLWRERPFFGGPLGDMFQSVDPLPTILSSKRVAAVLSNSLIEAMLWNRVACSPWGFISFSFACEKDLKSEKTVDIAFLNYLLFGFLLPGYSNIFNPDYWAWRKSGPAETDVYLKHLSICLTTNGLNEDILRLSEEERFSAIMRARGCDDYFISQTIRRISGDEINYEAILSCLRICDSEDHSNQYCLNCYIDEIVISKFNVSCAKNTVELSFQPIDRPGFVRLELITVEGAAIVENNNCVPSKGFYHFHPTIKLRIGNFSADSAQVTFHWRIKPINQELIHELIRNNEDLIHTTSYCNELSNHLNTSVCERDALIGELSTAIEQRDSLTNELSIAIEQRDNIIKEYTSVRAELEDAMKTILRYEASAPYKLARNFKKISRFIKGKENP